MEGQRTGQNVLEKGGGNFHKPPKSSKTKEVNVSMEKGKKRVLEREDDSDDCDELTQACAHTSKKQKDESDSELDSESEEMESNSTSMALTSGKFRPSEVCPHSPESEERKAEREKIRRKDKANGEFGLIYKITHKASERGYIGLTRQTFRKRMQGHFGKATNKNHEGGCQKLHAAIRKYGWDAFEKKCLYAKVPIRLLGAMEIVMISNHNTRAGNNGSGGFNLTDGGDQGGFCDPEVQRRAQERAKPAKLVAFASDGFKTKVGKESKKVWDALSPAQHQAKAQKQINGRHAEFVSRREAKIASLPNDHARRYYWQRQKNTCLGRIRRRMRDHPERFIGMDPIKDCEDWFGPSFEERRRE